MENLKGIEYPEEDDPFVEVPKQDIAVADEYYGHEVQRVGHQDWLDKGVESTVAIRSTIPAYPSKEDRHAVYDS